MVTFAVLCLLTACGKPEGDAESVRMHFDEIAGFEARVKILSDLEDSVLEYEIDYVYNREDKDIFTIAAPEMLAGIGGTIAGEDSGTFSLQYDDMMLDDIMPQRTGLTPADALFCLLSDMRSKKPTQQWTEMVSGKKLLVFRYEENGADGKVEKQVWLTENGQQPVCAEIYADGDRVLGIQMLTYQET